MTAPMHPLQRVLAHAAAGTFPETDGGVTVLPLDPSGIAAAVAFTGHAYVLTERDSHVVLAAGADGFGGALHPAVLALLAGGDRKIGSVDVVLVASATGGGPAFEPSEGGEHPRLQRALRYRREVSVLDTMEGIAVLGRGLADRWEVAVELHADTTPSTGAGRRLIRAALAALPPGTPLWAQVAPGNAASLRAFLAERFTPVGAEVLLPRR